MSFVLALFALALVAFKIYTAQIAIENLQVKSFSLIALPIIQSVPVSSSILLFLFILTCYLFIKINNAYRFVEYELSPFFFFLGIGFLIYPLSSLHITIFISLLLNLIALSVLMSVHNQPSVRTEIFTASSLVAIAAILFYPSFLFSLLVFSAIAILRPFQLKNYVLFIVSFCLPFLYLLAFAYLFNFNVNIQPIQLDLLDFHAPVFSIAYLPALLVGVVALVSSFKLYVSRSKFVVRQRNQLNLLYIFIFLLLFIALKTGLSNLLLFILLPFALFFNYLHKKLSRKWIPEVLLLLIYFSAFLLK